MVYLLDESLLTFEQDLMYVKEGKYRVPWDMELGLRHKQANPLFIANQASRLVAETRDILTRSWRQDPADKDVYFFSGEGKTAQSIYPDYYKTNFHYQTDGWMSDSSADVYETSTEAIFTGRQDAMLRSTMLPIHRWMEEKGLHSKEGKGASCLEVASGTGRLNTFVRDNWPMLDCTITDLSPFYLNAARKNSDYWLETRRQGKGSGTAKFAQVNAEDLSRYEDNSFDIVFSTYLFHEIPPSARANAAKEMARVCKPGGVVVFTDSHQLDDRPGMTNMAAFSRLNEPHYATYITENVPELFISAGLEPYEKHMISATKVMSFRKSE